MSLVYQNFKRVFISWRFVSSVLDETSDRKMGSKSLFFCTKITRESYILLKENVHLVFITTIQFFSCDKISAGGLQCLGIIELYGYSWLRNCLQKMQTLSCKFDWNELTSSLILFSKPDYLFSAIAFFYLSFNLNAYLTMS